MKRLIFLVIVCFLTTNSFGGGKMMLTSNSYPNKGNIPEKFVMKTIGGQNVSPQFHWDLVPEGTKSFALVMVDPHPVARNWIHWVVIDIPVEVTTLQEGFSNSGKCSKCRELKNSFGFKGYGGPQPPRGTGKHPYVTTVYALDCEVLSIKDKPTYQELMDAISPHVLAEASYTGYFEQK